MTSNVNVAGGLLSSTSVLAVTWSGSLLRLSRGSSWSAWSSSSCKCARSKKTTKRRKSASTCIDPARTRTAELADRHIAPRPGTDGALLFAVVHVLFEEGLVATDLGGIAEHVNGLDDVRSLAAGFSPEDVSVHCGVPADDIRALARELAAAPTAAVYGRIGTSTVEFGTLASWLVDVINILTGNPSWETWW